VNASPAASFPRVVKEEIHDPLRRGDVLGSARALTSSDANGSEREAPTKAEPSDSCARSALVREG
jgi:hypothetical protein